MSQKTNNISSARDSTYHLSRIYTPRSTLFLSLSLSQSTNHSTTITIMGPFRKSKNSDEFITMINGKVVRKEDAGKLPSRPRPPAAVAVMLKLTSSLRVKSVTDSIRHPGIVVIKNLVATKKVTFDALEVREYPIVIGDNPSCEEGPPLTIDWAFDPNTHFVIEIAQFELMRGERRCAEELKLDKPTRERVLLTTGTTQKEIVGCIRKLRKDQHSRMVSRNQDDSMHEKVENASRRFKKLVSRKSKYERDLEAATGSPTHHHSPTSVDGDLYPEDF